MEQSYKEILGRTIDLTSREQIAQYLNEETISFLSKLDDIWNETGIDVEDCEQRGFHVIKHVKDLYSDMLREAAEMKNNLAENITILLNQLSELAKELRIDINDDIKGYEHMTLATILNNLKEKLKKYKNIHVIILNEVAALNEKSKAFFLKLGREEKYLSTSPIPTDEDIYAYKNFVDELSLDVQKREETFLKSKQEIIELLSDLKMKASLDFEKSVLKGTEATFLLSDENMERLQNWLKSLKDQKKDLALKVADLRERVNMFWERLEISLEDRNNFLEAYPGSSLSSYQALKNEECRCKEQIKANIKIIVDKMRQEIKDWWKKCHYGEVQKEEFPYLHTDCYTEDLLTLHEIYIDKLRDHYENNKLIYDLILKRDQLWRSLRELDDKPVTADRLKNRGGTLLHEEKQRTAVKVRLPKIEEQLESLLEKYEAESGKSFLILDQKVTEIIINDWEKFKENRVTKLSAKKMARELQNTPSGSRALSNANVPVTPRSAKRKVVQTLFTGSTKKERPTPKKTPRPKINSSIIKRRSLERRKRLEPKRNSNGKSKSKPTLSTATDYPNFKRGLENQPACRSTLQIPNIQIAGPSGTPKRTLLPRTPSRSNLRSKSPLSRTNCLTPAAGNFPIII